MAIRYPLANDTAAAAAEVVPMHRASLRSRGKLGDVVTALAATLMLTQCVCGSNNRPTEIDSGPVRTPPVDAAGAQGDRPEDAATPNAPIKLPASIDTKDLDNDEKRVLQRVLEDQYDPCGKAHSFLTSLEDPKTCPEAHKLAALAVTKIAQGLSHKQVIQELLKEQARWARKSTFDLTDSPRHGDPASAKKVIVEFFDYQCPHCKVAAKPARELADKAGAVLYYKMLPLEIHPHAKEAALVALAANRQGKFEALHYLLFDNQEILTPELIRELAAKAGCDMKRLAADLEDPALAKILERDMKEADAAELSGTPTFFVDGYEVEYEELERALE
jgi:protein-disulfide isomerase